MHNRALRKQVLDWEARLRKRDLFVGEPGIAAFYDARLPSDVRDRPSLLAWCATRANDRALTMTAADVASREPTEITPERYPSDLEIAGQPVPLRYKFEPGADDDGVTLEIPRALLGALRPEHVEWLVPGWLAEKVVALLRGLPKELRRPLVPLPDAAADSGRGVRAASRPSAARERVARRATRAAPNDARPEAARRACTAAASLDADRGSRRGRSSARRGARSARAATRVARRARRARGARGRRRRVDPNERFALGLRRSARRGRATPGQSRRAALSEPGRRPRPRRLAASAARADGRRAASHRRAAAAAEVRAATGRVDSRASAQGPRARARVSRCRRRGRARRRSRARERGRGVYAAVPRSARAPRSMQRSTRGARSSSRRPTRCARCCARSRRSRASCAAT